MTGGDPYHSGSLRTLRRAIFCVSALFFAALLPAQAQAQTRTTIVRTSTAEAAILDPASLLKLDDMNFGRIAARATAGTVTLDPTTSTCATSGGIVHAGVCQPAQFAGRGRNNLFARFDFPNSINLNRAGGGTMLLDNFDFDASSDLLLILKGGGNGGGSIRYLILSPAGIFTFRVGGILHVGANQAPGVYSGTFNVTVQYN